MSFDDANELLPSPEPAHLSSPPTSVASVSQSTAVRKLTQHGRNRRTYQTNDVLHSIETDRTSVSATATTEDPISKYFTTQAALEGQDAGCVFLLWGRSTATNLIAASILKAIDIPFRAVEGDLKPAENEVFAQLRRKFYENTKSWPTRLGLREITRVKPVRFRMIKCTGSELLVNTLTEDFMDGREARQTAIDELEKRIDRYPDPGDFCFPAESPSGKEHYQHNHPGCGVLFPDMPFEPCCPFEDWDRLHSQIQWYDTLSFLTFYFLHPDGARGQTILSNPTEESFIHRYSHLCSPERSQRRFEVFTGLYVEEQWRQVRVIPLVVVVLLSTLLVSRLIWRDWEVVFGAASLVATAMTLVYTMSST